MQYRKFGNTGVRISSVSFGGMRFPEVEKDGKWLIDEEKAIPLLRRAYEKGINYYDSAFFYNHENSQVIIGKALKDVRDKVYFTNKVPMWGGFTKTAEYREYLEKSLKLMDTDYIDFYHFWGIGKETFDEKIVKLGLLKEAIKAKEEGLIKHISFSFHDAPENMKYIIDKAEVMETVLCQYNILDRSNEQAIAYAASKGLGVVAMGPVAGGKLSAPAEMYKKVTGKESNATYELAIRFVLGNKNISSALCGMTDLDMLEKDAAVGEIEEPMTSAEWEKVTLALEETKKLSDLYCTACGYCQPCPAKINIPRLFGIYTNHNVYGLSEAAKIDYSWYKQNPNDGLLPEVCTDCGYCEEKCPQKIEIRKRLKDVVNILEKL